jgi:hypothetical protein
MKLRIEDILKPGSALNANRLPDEKVKQAVSETKDEINKLRKLKNYQKDFLTGNF